MFFSPTRSSGIVAFVFLYKTKYIRLQFIKINSGSENREGAALLWECWSPFFFSCSLYGLRQFSGSWVWWDLCRPCVCKDFSQSPSLCGLNLTLFFFCCCWYHSLFESVSCVKELPSWSLSVLSRLVKSRLNLRSCSLAVRLSSCRRWLFCLRLAISASRTTLSFFSWWWRDGEEDKWWVNHSHICPLQHDA